MTDVSSPKQASELLRQHGLRPQKRLGQNFLCDRNTLDRIARAANLSRSDSVLEIGGGMGALTLTLAELASSVTTVEIDQHLVPILTELTAQHPNVHLLFADFLKLDLQLTFDDAFGAEKGAVVANIPYYITSPILERLIDHKDRISRIVLLVQHEFAQRMVAPPGSDDCGSMSLYVQFHTRAEIIGTVPRTVFLPPPDVSSAIVALTPVEGGTIPVQNSERMFYIIRAAFAQRRKTLLNALMRAPASFGLGFTMDDRLKVEQLLASVDIDGTRRGETLSLTEFARISDAMG